jgi:tyrosyl-tRNA synthetase
LSINDIIAPENQYKDETGILKGNHVKAKAMHWVATRRQKGNICNYTLVTLLSILRKITFNRLIERDMFQDRLKNGEPVFMHEMMYPVIQGIDSDAIANIYGSCDLEVGGSDQTFNMLVGRDVMGMNKKEPQSVMSFKILEGLDGKVKMSKSLDNYITINEKSNEMFGKIMSIPDTSIINYFELCTYEPISEIEKIKKTLSGGKINPKDFKVRLAKEIVAIYHGEKAANEAEDNFIKVFQNKEIPEDMPELKAVKGEILSELLVANKILKSKSEFSRLVEEKALHDLDSGEPIQDLRFKVEKNIKLKIGKKRFLKINL